MWYKLLRLWQIACILMCSYPIFGAQKSAKSEADFEMLMGTCNNSQYQIHRLSSNDRKNFKILQGLYQTNIKFLAKSPLFHIPHQLHLIWIGPKPFPEESIENVKSFRKYHPDWVMNFWTDSPDRPTPIPGMKKRLINDEYFSSIIDLYNKSTNYGEKADLLRFVIMYREGGLYFDHDATCLRSFAKFFDHYDFVAACERLDYHKGINSCLVPAIGLFLSRPGHPILAKTLDLVRQRWNTVPNYPPRKHWLSVIYRTFDSFAKASMLLHNQRGNRDLILPTSYFYPNFIFSKSLIQKLFKAGYVYSVHECTGAWRTRGGALYSDSAVKDK